MPALSALEVELQVLHQRLNVLQGCSAFYAYVHVPFCASRCHYCDFYLKLAKYGGVDAFVHRLLSDVKIAFSHYEKPNGGLKTLYLGGGTPSLLSLNALEAILEAFHKRWGLHPEAEITLEANPDDVSDAWVKAVANIGFNRISLGVQHTHPKVLKLAGRRHTCQEAFKAIESILTHLPSQNLSVDAMYGLPQDTPAGWEACLKQLLCFPIKHLSLYGLQLEAASPLATLHQKRPEIYVLPNDDAHVQAYQCAQGLLEAAGFIQYEVSNFAQVGYESQHNLAYWRQHNTLAYGPSAVGYDYPQRVQWKPDLTSFLKLENRNTLQALTPVSPEEHLENLLIFGLRLPEEGVSTGALFSLCTGLPRLEQALKKCISALVGQGVLHQEGGLRVPKEMLPKLHDMLMPVIHFVHEV